jgi:hypothetical protein
MALLSVIVTIMNGATQLRRCLRALSSQVDAPPPEIIVPVFNKLDGAAALRHEWPAVRFIEIPDQTPPAHGFQHWKYDRRRAVGVACARGDVIALTDEYAIPPERWCAMILDRHAASDAEVIGGALRLRTSKLINRAAFLCDFARFEPPFAAGETTFASLVNVSYKRSVLEKCSDEWRDFFDETVVHEHIRGAGGRMFLDPDLMVDYDHGELLLAPLLRGKYESGRTFAGRRIRNAGTTSRIPFVAGAPILPVVLLGRKLGAAIASRQRDRLVSSRGARANLRAISRGAHSPVISASRRWRLPHEERTRHIVLGGYRLGQLV